MGYGMKLWVPPTKREQRLKKMRKARDYALNKAKYDAIQEYCQFRKDWSQVPIVKTQLFGDDIFKNVPIVTTTNPTCDIL